MDEQKVRGQLLMLLERVGGFEIKDCDKNLFGREYDFMPMDLAYVWMELKRRFQLDLNEMIPRVQFYSVNGIVQAVMEGR